ncbi:serine hydrolase [Mesohalobacter halotolerans]|uniref:serine hydrolase n=1 Tax=Mesohalobacter halotolerans TaxID=1883405 RepID=UPI0029392F43|nr:serine hydrolase [Mesohalobacter halotolerans]
MIAYFTGGIYSNTGDLSKFVMAQFDDREKLLTMTQNKTFEVNKNLVIALGWHIVKQPNRDQLLWHNGGTGDYTSSIAIDLKNQKAVIILSNVSAFHPRQSNIDKLTFEILKDL